VVGSSSSKEPPKQAAASGITANTQGTGISLRELPPVVAGYGPNTGQALSIRRLFLDTPSTAALSGEEQAQPQRQTRNLIANLDLDLAWGQKLLILGPSGIGKSSLLRAIAGLWNSGSGSIERAHVSDVYFLPQKPYCPLGSLRDQLLYPFRDERDNSNERAAADDDVASRDPPPENATLLDILSRVDLPDLAKRFGDGDPCQGLNAVVDWGNVLSLGEQQRLAFGRILVHDPSLVILDEATSAVDVQAEATLYGLLSDKTCVSVGHRPTLLRYHDVRLKLHKREYGSDGGNYTLGTIHSTADGGVAAEEVDLFFR
jgi:ABC-type uncharacterized transport system fused permease/ATPase subunit